LVTGTSAWSGRLAWIKNTLSQETTARNPGRSAIFPNELEEAN